MSRSDTPLKLYSELADWFHLLTTPESYAEEAAFYAAVLRDVFGDDLRTLLELGSGGGNNAWHMKRDFELTLSDRSPDMIRLSQRINPECEHVVGDMRELRIGRSFDAVFIHDGIMYVTSEADLSRVMRTAFAHTAPGGAVLIAPDCTTETYRDFTTHGGHDSEGRALRYLQWTNDPDPDDTEYDVDFVYMLREDGRPLRVVQERHSFGLFPRATWFAALEAAGYEEVCALPSPTWEGGPDEPIVFTAYRP